MVVKNAGTGKYPSLLAIHSGDPMAEGFGDPVWIAGMNWGSFHLRYFCCVAKDLATRCLKEPNCRRRLYK